MNEAIKSYLRKNGVVFSKDHARLFVPLLRELYEWGMVDTWKLTKGLQPRACRVLERLRDLGLACQVRQEHYITEAGMKFVEQHKLSALME